VYIILSKLVDDCWRYSKPKQCHFWAWLKRPGHYDPSLGGAISWIGAGSERWFTGVPQILVIGWSLSSRFKSRAPPTATRRRRHGTVTALWTSSWCPPSEWGLKLVFGFFPPYTLVYSFPQDAASVWLCCDHSLVICGCDRQFMIDEWCISFQPIFIMLMSDLLSDLILICLRSTWLQLCWC